MLADLKNPLHLSQDALDSLKQVLQAASELDDNLPDQLLRYLIDGTEEGLTTAILQGVRQYCDQHLAYFFNGAYEGKRLTSALPAQFSLRHADCDRGLLAWLIAHPIDDTAFYTRLLRVLSCFYENRLDASGQLQLGLLCDRFSQILQDALPAYYFDQGEAPPPALPFLNAAIIEGVYLADGQATDTFARDVYDVGSQDYRQQHLAKHAANLMDFAAYTCEHATVVHEVLQQSDRERRIHALNVMQRAKVPVGPFLEAIVTAAVASAKTEREAALPLIQPDLATALPALQAKAESGSASERQQAVKLLWELAGEAVKPFLEERLAVEKNAKTKAALKTLLASPAADSAPASTLSLPPLAAIDVAPPLPTDITDTLEKIVAICNQGKLQSRRSLLQSLKSAHQGGKALEGHFGSFGLALEDKAAIIDIIDLQLAASPLDETEATRQFSRLLDQRTKQTDIAVDSLMDTLQRGNYDQCWQFAYLGAQTYFNQLKQEAKALLALPGWHLIHAARLIAFIGQLRVQPIQKQATIVLSPEGHELLMFYRSHHPNCGGLREFAAVLEVLDINGDLIASEMLDYWIGSGFWRWEETAIWPYFAERSQFLENALLKDHENDWREGYDGQLRRQNGFRALKTFPQPLAQFLPMLWNLALEGPKAERGMAQACLNALAETPERLLTALTHPDHETRTIAAAWLGDRGDPAAIKPLKQALQKEKSDAVKDVMLRSLEKLGASIDELLNRAGLLKESQTLLKKGVPSALDWFPWEALPTVHWQDTGETVAPEILQGLVVQCFKQKTPEPGPMLKRYGAMWRPDEREALGQVVLESWIQQDTLPVYTPEAAAQLAQTDAQRELQYNQQLQQQYPNATEDPFFKNTYEDIYRRIYNGLIRTCRGSAVKEKGILAIAAVCCGPQGVPLISRYLKTWYGNRMAQCKALLQVLAWMDDNSAIQLLLSIANRFRTKGIQQEAEKLVTELAERNGWSRDELSDRTLPTAGFDDGVEQILDYGSRQFTLLLDTDLSLVLKHPDGKVIKSLPAARQDDDPELVKEAKKQFADAKKQMKQVLTLQRERLFEAMATQRSWRFSDWDTYVNRHPIVGRYCQQLVWAVFEPRDDGETLVNTVRPLEDRTLTDAHDEEVKLDATAIVRLAHSCTVPAEEVAAWQTHFTDYNVIPLFPQFRSNPYVLPAAQQTEIALNDFEGYVIEAFKLRGLLSKQGYVRGETEDAGWFYDYGKRFAGLGVEVVVGFSGNFLPEENRQVVLTTVSVYRLPEGAEVESLYHRSPIPLGELPPVLLSEVWSELQAIAAQGSGYDPDWYHKVAF